MVAAGAVVAAVSGLVAVAPAAERDAGATAEAARLATERAAAKPAPALTVRPHAARRGGRVVLFGSGFRAGVRVMLLAGPPTSEAVRIGSATTDAQGEFVAPIAIERRVRPGRYVALACRHDCRVKASAMFRVLE
ncbi:hypothetical protein Q5424_06110 [Conexibacter sp. JD483]|uniref:hypothetical protein n=2 Tax=Conexibacter TaxID=191494 RepID=UPI0028709AD7|nr:hypothetical protein [Conexibacter sp. JD483]MDR9368643.1 hypothetical protein [Conexibacter sp. JD483]